MSIVISSLSLLNFIVLVGVTLLTIMLSNGRRLNRLLAMLLIAAIFARGLTIARYTYTTSFETDRITLITKLIGVLTLLAAWLLFDAVQTLVGERDWTRATSRGLAIIGLLIVTVVLITQGGLLPVASPETATPITLLSGVMASYIFITCGCSIALLWQMRRQRIGGLFSAGLIMLLLSLGLVILGGNAVFGLYTFFATAAALLLAFGLVRAESLNGFANERARLAIARAAGVSLSMRLELDDLLTLIAQQAAGLAGTTACVVFVRNPESLALAATFGVPPEIAVEDVSKLLGGLAARAADQRRTIHVPDYRQWSGRIELGASGTASPSPLTLRTAAAIPLIFSDEVIGVLSVFELNAGRIYEADDLAVLELLAPQAAIAIVNARAYAQLMQREQRIADERDHLWRINEAVGQMLAVSDAEFRLRVVANAIQGLGWGHVSILLFDPNLQVIKRLSSSVSGPKAAGNLNDGQSDKVHEAEPLDWDKRLKNLSAQARIGVGYYLPATEAGTEAALFIPLRLSDGTLAGVIDLHPSDNPKAPSGTPTEESLRPLAILAAQAAATLENSRLLTDLRAAKVTLTEQVEELTMLQHVDQELNATLNLDNVMALTIDWALRRTGARAGIIAVMTTDGSGLIPLVTPGYPSRLMPYNADNPMPLSQGIIGRVARTNQISVVPDVAQDPDYNGLLPGIRSQIVVPLDVQGRVLGLLSLESERLDAFKVDDVGFVRRLSARAAIAVDNARLYNAEEHRADEMSQLYEASRAISSSLDRIQFVPQIAQSVAILLGTSSALVTDYRVDRSQASILTRFRVGTAQSASERLPAEGDLWEVSQMPAMRRAIQSHDSLTLRRADPNLTPWERGWLDQLNVQALLLIPLVLQKECLGVILALESRRDRIFTDDDLLMSESLASQAAIAFRQARLYEEVRELETLKSEMIRMAAHDLRGPLGNVMGYVDLLNMQIGNQLTPMQVEFIANIRDATGIMKSLIDDLLTLERVESERQSSWAQIDLGQLVQDSYEAQLPTAALKNQTLRLERGHERMLVYGSTTQLRQAITNLINNAIKYTPDEGHIIVRVKQADDRAQFEVQDNGYGISKERQARLFQMFYRAHQPGTDHIAGTGLGLSLVKAVINRHSGDVWVSSEVGQGSTFGFWLPDPRMLMTSASALSLADNE